MTFNITNQTGGVINNVAGDQRISGGQAGSVVTLDAARAAARQLRAAVTAAPLPPGIAATARTEAAELDAEMRGAAPDRPAVAERLHRLTRALAGAGSLAAAAASMIGPIQTLAGWLGRLGEPVAHILLPLL
jgi:hypothetical protein